ncbi:hypothetical protein [uncultured Paracoccus sp.]|uniref:hypothetical protein n=1 Tax=uncultured Paracoccus sp. TaxID=189685 RepID=UPI0025CE14F6|nr:hypothetical protein [uncultured Paracoccus sp.]
MSITMKTLATVLGALILATGTAQAASFNAGNRDADTPSIPVVASHPVQVKAADVLSPKELARSGIDANTELTVSDFTAPGPRKVETR